MKLAIMQPYFFPYIGYYQAISAVDKYILYDNVNYIRHGYMNRNRYLIDNGKPNYIIMPIRHQGSHNKIREVELAVGQPWRKKILNKLYHNYKRSLYFNDIIPVIEKVLNTDTNLLSTLNKQGIIDVSRYLDISTEIVTDVSRNIKIWKRS